MHLTPIKPSCLFTAVLFTTIATFAPMASAQETILHSFVYGTSDGLGPYSSLLSDGKGNFYGTTVYGGSVGSPFNFDGTVYKMSPAAGGTWTETVLYSFGVVSNDGVKPVSGLVFDAKGNLYGTTTAGGANGTATGGEGTVFELSPGAGGVWTEKVLYSFGATTTDGIEPGYGSLIFDAKGNLYGTTLNGGANGDGTVFELVAGSGGTWTEKILYSFGATSTDAMNPHSGLTFDAQGNLYGTTYNGGTYDYGTVFELKPGASGTWKETLLHSFDRNNIDGTNPTCNLIFDAQGNIYGTTKWGGGFANGIGFGTVFELTPFGDNWTEQVLYSFTGSTTNGDGQNPIAGLTFDAAGNLYGTTSAGGVPQVGTVFALLRGSAAWTEKLVYTFSDNTTDGRNPYGGVVFDAAGNLYGTTTAGGINSFQQYGVVFEIAKVVTAAPTFSPAGGAFSAAQTVKITDATPGATIYYAINESTSSTRYTGPISVSKSQTISAIAVTTALPQSQVASASYQIGSIAATPEFLPIPGTYALPQAVTLIDAAPHATIYYTTNGTTPTTSSAKYSGPIKVSSTETIKAMAVATGYTDSPVGSATYTITPFVPPTEKVLYNFAATASDGDLPFANLTSDGKGNLYGTTKYGGTHKTTYAGVTTTAGTVFELLPATGGGWSEKVLYNFGATTTDATHPVAPLVFDSKGNLYGTTFGGGTWGLGTVFELSPGAGGVWTEKVLHDFGGTLKDGEVPEAGLIFDSKGNLYGTTEAGGAYDVTYEGASNGYGTVFEMSPGSGGTWTEKILYSFDYLSQTDGYYPTAGLVFDSKGNLYGTTQDGGSGQDLEGGGTVFELSPAGTGWTEKVLFSFGGGASNGYRIEGGIILDGEGNLYGTATAGGNGFGLDGTLFELSPEAGGTWTETVLHSFGAFEGDGINPVAGLVSDSAGDLYGTTFGGGANGVGTVFELKKESGGGWIENVLHSFDLSGTDGANPSASLMFDDLGNLYGTTGYGGTHGSSTTGGTVFEIDSGLTKVSTATTLASSANPSISGKSVTITATVKPEFAGTPAGTVTFKNGTTTLATVTLSGGEADYTTSTLAVGTNSITAVYNGGTVFDASTSAALKQVVDKAAATVASSGNPSKPEERN